MPTNNEHLRVVSLKDILGNNLEIPRYQRPYRWTMESAVTLFADTFNAFCSKIPEYRIGSVILHDNDGKMEIVDGQQRLTTLTILFYCIYQHTNNEELKNMLSLLDSKFNNLSIESIVNNHIVLYRKVDEISENTIIEYGEYLLNKCTMVRIVTKSEQEAFQFFDSQNTRGKALAPHDLLKSYHLREMRNEDISEKINIIERWEATKQKKLEQLFKDNLYPLVRWYKKMDGLGYSSKSINAFKGIKPNSSFNFSVYNRAANLYIERFNKDGMYELTSGKIVNQFQLTQPIISGKRFFEYSLHYFELKGKIEQRIETVYSDNDRSILLPENRQGDSYIKGLFVNVVMFFVDKFNYEELTDSRLELLYKWAYSLRIVMKSVYKESVNRYALGIHERINTGVNLFAIISEMHDPSEMEIIVLDSIDRTKPESYSGNAERYKDIFERIAL